MALDDIEALMLKVSFVDDGAIVITASVPMTLKRRVRRAVQVLAETFHHYGMTVNWKAGKTEAIVIFRGKGAVKEREDMMNPDGRRILSVTHGYMFQRTLPPNNSSPSTSCRPTSTSVRSSSVLAIWSPMPGTALVRP